MHSLTRWLAIGTVAVLGICLPPISRAQTAAPSAPPKAGAGSSTGDQADLPIYRPPLRGAPAGRLGAATRGGTAAVSTLDVMAPDHVGLTRQEQPTLYWFAASPIAVRLQLTLVSEDAEKPLIEVDLRPALGAGIHAFRLADTKAKLQIDREYEWSVAAIVDPAARSKDEIASGVIERVAGQAGSPTDLAAATRAYASDGIWYDAFDAASRDVDRNPRDPRAHLRRAALLDQVGLKTAAAFERGLAK